MPRSPAPTSAMLPAHEVVAFREKLSAWYRLYARRLPWRGVNDPYRTWLSEIMLQQTRVAAVIAHYHDFLGRFPTIQALAAAPESDVLAAWSGLGYYRRARMMHKAARFVAQELGGVVPGTAAELRKLPGIGDYTCAAIASICFGESIAVVDGNVERVLLRVTGRAEEATAAGRAFVQQQAAGLVPLRRFDGETNAAGDHNQAMMELGATICLPRAPLCLQCPIFALCRTRGEHPTPPRTKARNRPAAYLLSLRKKETEVLLERRPDDASLMPGMYELPPLPMDAVAGREPLLTLRHSITNTIYTVEIHTQADTADHALQKAVPASEERLHWAKSGSLGDLPITGLTRKVLQRLKVMHKKSSREP